MKRAFKSALKRVSATRIDTSATRIDASATRIGTSATRIEAPVELFWEVFVELFVKDFALPEPQNLKFFPALRAGLKACMLDSLPWTKGEMCRECQKSRKKFPNARGDFL